ncbi:MAG: hypothetical protein AAF640_02965 [Pseudomonadota bacterium]
MVDPVEPAGPRAVGGTPPLKRVRRGSRRAQRDPSQEGKPVDRESDKDNEASPRKGRHIDERC